MQAAALPTSQYPDLLQLSGVSHLAKATCGIVTAVAEHVKNKLGMKYPGLESKPAIKSIPDPANLGPEASPAVQAAAKVKAEEEQAPQKIKGLRYLASIGCGGCYPDVEEALLAGLDGCTEEVRYEAASAIRSTVGNPCTFCKASACCSPQVREKLKKIAFDIDETGCFKEPSPRVRRLARLALAGCGGGEVFDDIPVEGPEELPELAPEEGPTDPNIAKKDPSIPGADTNKIQLVSASEIASAPKPETGTNRSRTSQTDSKTMMDRDVTWEQIMIDPTQFGSADRARQVIIYLRARARGKEATRPEFKASEVSMVRQDWTHLSEIKWDEARTHLGRIPIGGVSPILTRGNRWYLLRLLGRRPPK